MSDAKCIEVQHLQVFEVFSVTTQNGQNDRSQNLKIIFSSVGRSGYVQAFHVKHSSKSMAW